MGYGGARIDTAAVEFVSTDAIFANAHPSGDLGKGKTALFFLSWPWHPGLMDLVHPETIVVISNGGLPSALQLFGSGPEGSEASGEPSPTYGRFDLEGKKVG